MEKKEQDFFGDEENQREQTKEWDEVMTEETREEETREEETREEETREEETREEKTREEKTRAEETGTEETMINKPATEESGLEKEKKKERFRGFEKIKTKKKMSFFTGRKKKRMVIGVILFLIFLVIFAFYRGSVFMDAYQECEDAYYSMKEERDYLSADNASLEKDKEALQEEYDNVLSENEELKAQDDELKNGAAAQLVAIKNAYEKKKWDKVISLTDTLHEKYNGSAEDAEAQKLKEKAKSEKETEAKKKAEEEKKGYETGITFSNLARDPDQYEGEKVKFTGKVLQTMEDDGVYAVRLAVNSDYDTVIYAIYMSDVVSSRILEDDVITIYGVSTGLYSYESTMSGTITIPSVIVDKIEQ